MPPSGKKRHVVCHCHRAWLPPSFTWLFPPRSPLHTCGSFYFEWAGHKDEAHPLCAFSYSERTVKRQPRIAQPPQVAAAA